MDFCLFEEKNPTSKINSDKINSIAKVVIFSKYSEKKMKELECDFVVECKEDENEKNKKNIFDYMSKKCSDVSKVTYYFEKKITSIPSFNEGYSDLFTKFIKDSFDDLMKKVFEYDFDEYLKDGEFIEEKKSALAKKLVEMFILESRNETPDYVLKAIKSNEKKLEKWFDEVHGNEFTKLVNKKSLNVPNENPNVKRTFFFEQANQEIVYANELLIMSKEDTPVANVSSKISNLIIKDNVDDLRNFVELNEGNFRFSNRVFTMCALHKAGKCFEYFYSLLTDSEQKQERSFSCLARDQIKNNKNFAGENIYKAATSPSADKSFKSSKKLEATRFSIIPDDLIFTVIRENIIPDKEGTKKMLALFKQYKVVASDEQLYSIMQETHKFTGYASMIFNFIHDMSNY